ncbi:hypothetical protein FZZ93_17315 [Halomonas eurihalina]|uniref:Uncharacterized protein n=1 Tax=Halomonas eurihalina TaxID=42566 RepID=A0A5D9CI07_HALER|nr:hypothetical protein [Halomonas eurihalina]MDR5860437.1 hypothetical protein [Halomonas eurihalina]TZG31324.1 hypothetical protein FZZ93_17315 [Halomonas eurihalina]
MAANKPKTPRPDMAQPHRAGDIRSFPGGKVSYLSPVPLPTGSAPVDFNQAIGEMNDAYLDFGGSLPTPFTWQFTLGIPFIGFLMMAFLIPVMGGGVMWAISKKVELFYVGFDGLFNESFSSSLVICTLALIMALVIKCQYHFKFRNDVPTRFHRQRREVAFAPGDGKPPIIVPWESIAAWVTQAQGATQYGVQRQYGLGLGFIDPETGQQHFLELPQPGLSLAMGLWESVRAYMEYEVHTREEIQDPNGLHRPGDPPYEGVHTFHNARRRLHRRHRDGEIGLFKVSMWYLWHILVLWTLPFHLTEWEIRAIHKAGRKTLPASLDEWSQPLPKEQWAEPSEELKRLSAEVRQRHAQQPNRPITAIFAEVYAEETTLSA